MFFFIQLSSVATEINDASVVACSGKRNRLKCQISPNLSTQTWLRWRSPARGRRSRSGSFWSQSGLASWHDKNHGLVLPRWSCAGWSRGGQQFWKPTIIDVWRSAFGPSFQSAPMELGGNKDTFLNACNAGSETDRAGQTVRLIVPASRGAHTARDPRTPSFNPAGGCSNALTAWFTTYSCTSYFRRFLACLLLLSTYLECFR